MDDGLVIGLCVSRTHVVAGSEEYSDAQVALVNQQALELVEWSSLLLQSPSVAVDDIEGAPRNLGPAAGTSRCIVPASAQLHNRCCNATKERVSGAAEFDSAESIFDTLAFDYAPSFGYYMDGFAFDTELRGVMRATMFNSEIVVRRQESFAALTSGNFSPVNCARLVTHIVCC